MMLTILSGPAQSGKTERLLTRYRAALLERPPGSTLWLAPTWRAAAEVRLRLFDGTFCGCFSPGVMTFAKFAETVLHASGLPIRPIDRLMKRELVRQIIEDQAARGRLSHFRSIAATGGLVDLVCEFIGELKRLEIWPEEFQQACTARGIGDKDVELAEIYQSYQQSLLEHGLFDAEGRFWSARDVLAKGNEGRGAGDEGRASDQRPNPQSLIPNPSFVAIDGFTDFTRTQHEIIEILAGRAETAIVTLPLEPDSQRTDLFAKPLKTLAELQRRHAALQIEEAARPETTAWPAMRHLEQTVFVNPRTRQADAETPWAADGQDQDLRIEVLAAARQLGEIELIAGRIKRLLVDGHAKPSDVAVVFRSPQEVGGTVCEVFERTGIPVMLESGQSLDRSPTLRALTALLQLDVDDWPFDRLLAVLGSNFFRPRWREWQDGQALPTLERAIRTLQIPRGRERLIEQLRSEEAETQNEVADRVSLGAVQRLADALDALPERATLPDWAKAWQRLAEETGLLRAMGSSEQPGPVASDAKCSLSDWPAWNRLLAALAAGDTLAGWLHRRPPELDRRAALDALLDILHAERVGHAGDESGYVRVLSASSVRSLRIPYLFMAGLSEKAFPPPDREDRLYSEAEYARLIEAGLPFVARNERTREEMLLFYEAVTRASRRLYLSYPALDESAQPLLPSPFLREVEDAFGQGRLPRTERADLSPVPVGDEPVNDAEFRIMAVDAALKGNVALLAGWFGGTRCGDGKDTEFCVAEADNLAAGLHLLDLRLDRDRFGPAEGVLQSPAARDRMAGLFPLDESFSATELERYASCPYRFFAERVLKIEPVEDLALEFDVLARGSMVHDAMAAFHRRVNERLGRAGSPLELDPAEFDALLDAAVQESLPPEPANPVRAAMREIDRRLIVQWLTQYRGQLEKYEQQWAGFDRTMSAELLEVSFGRGDPAAPSTAQSLEFPCDAQTVRISGRIDRVDTGVVAGKTVFNVLDYKTGGAIKVTPETIRAGTTLQLPLYSLAAMELLLAARDALPWQAGYWYVRDGGFKPRQALKMYRNDDGRIELETVWEEVREGLGDTVVSLVDAMRKGQFPVCSADDHCTGRCPYSTICRINQVRSLEKTCQPTANL